MTVNIFLQNDSKKGYIATALEFPNCVAEGKTKAEALKNTKTAILEKLSDGELISLQIEPQNAAKPGNPWIANFGLFLDSLNDFTVLDFDEGASQQFESLRQQKIRIGTQDLRIASIVLATGGILVSRNRKDFRQVPNLTIEDWSQPQA